MENGCRGGCIDSSFHGLHYRVIGQQNHVFFEELKISLCFLRPFCFSRDRFSSLLVESEWIGLSSRVDNTTGDVGAGPWKRTRNFHHAVCKLLLNLCNFRSRALFQTCLSDIPKLSFCSSLLVFQFLLKINL